MKNSNNQNYVGKSLAIAWFAKNHYQISLPLDVHLPYDLLVDKGDGLIKKVRVATTSYKNPYDNFEVSLRSMCANYYGTPKITKFQPSLIDYLFVDCEHKEFYLIPSHQIYSNTKIVMTSYSQFKVFWEDS